MSIYDLPLRESTKHNMESRKPPNFGQRAKLASFDEDEDKDYTDGSDIDQDCDQYDSFSFTTKLLAIISFTDAVLCFITVVVAKFDKIDTISAQNLRRLIIDSIIMCAISVLVFAVICCRICCYSAQRLATVLILLMFHFIYTSRLIIIFGVDFPVITSAETFATSLLITSIILACALIILSARIIWEVIHTMRKVMEN